MNLFSINNLRLLYLLFIKVKAKFMKITIIILRFQKIKIAMLILLFLLGTTSVGFAQSQIPDFNSYQIVSASTGNVYELKAFDEEKIIQTNLEVISKVKNILIRNKIDVSKINILLYVDELSTDIKRLRTEKNSINLQVVSSPWIELAQTINNSKTTEIELKIDAGYVRLMMDLFSYQNEAITVQGFRKIPYIDSACFKKIEKAYISNEMSDGYEIFQLANAFDCVPKPMRRPLLSLFESSPQTDLFPITESVYQKLDSCLDTAKKYYSQLYPRLILRGLQILESKSDPESLWWIEILEQLEPINRCSKNI